MYLYSEVSEISNYDTFLSVFFCVLILVSFLIGGVDTTGYCLVLAEMKVCLVSKCFVCN